MTVAGGELVRLLAQPLARLVGHRQRVGHLAHVLDEHQVPEVLEQVEDEPAEILALLGELLEEDQRAGRVAVDDEVAEPEQHLVLDRAEELQHVLHRDPPPVAAASWSSVDSASRNAPRAAARDQRERRVRHVDLLAVGDPAQLAHEVGQARPLEDEGLAARAHGRQHLLQLGRAEDEDEVGGGSSISFSSAFHAASVSWCASSRM